VFGMILNLEHVEKCFLKTFFCLWGAF
jgi:hypothetical protein